MNLLSGHTQRPVTAVLVESQKFYYIYRDTPARAAVGQHDIVELQLAQGETVLGARLLDQEGGLAVVLLTQKRLIVHILTLPVVSV